MMICPESYLEEVKDKSYEELIEERDELIRSIQTFEKQEMTGKRSEEKIVSPSPEVVYQWNLEYLTKLCAFMRDKYNEEYVWGDKTLHKNLEENEDA